MNHRSKAYLSKAEVVAEHQTWEPAAALAQIRNTSPSKFDATVEVVFKLRINPRHADQQVKGSLLLPAGHGRKPRLLVLTRDQAAAARDAGADHVGGKEMIAKIKDEKWSDFELIIASPEIMAEISQIAAIIGRRGYMPNTKLGTVSRDLAKTVTEFKTKRVIYKNDKAGNLHLILGKTSWSPVKLMENYQAVLKTVQRQKPVKIKGNYIKTAHVTTTMGPAFKLKLS